MSQCVMNVVQIVVWLVAIVGGLIAATKALAEMHRSNNQRSEDMRWKRAEMGKKCIDEIVSSSLAAAALKMLDWENLSYEMPNGKRTSPISHDFRRKALRITETVFAADGEEQFIRDAFDALFDGFQLLEHFIRIDLIIFVDVKAPFAYFVTKMSGPKEFPVINEFVTGYEFKLAEDFLKRFPDWNANQLKVPAAL